MAASNVLAATTLCQRLTSPASNQRKKSATSETEMLGVSLSSPLPCRRAVISRRLRFSQDSRTKSSRKQWNLERSKCCSLEEGRIRYTYKGIIYITTKDHVGIVAFRIAPTQCTCRIKKPNPPVDQTGEDLSYDKAMYRAYGRWKEDDRARRAYDHLAIGLKKAEISSCPYVDPESLLYSQVYLRPPSCLQSSSWSNRCSRDLSRNCGLVKYKYERDNDESNDARNPCLDGCRIAVMPDLLPRLSRSQEVKVLRK